MGAIRVFNQTEVNGAVWSSDSCLNLEVGLWMSVEFLDRNIRHAIWTLSFVVIVCLSCLSESDAGADMPTATIPVYTPMVPGYAYFFRGSKLIALGVQLYHCMSAWSVICDRILSGRTDVTVILPGICILQSVGQEWKD